MIMDIITCKFLSDFKKIPRVVRQMQIILAYENPELFIN
jgi:hypothetical protein